MSGLWFQASSTTGVIVKEQTGVGRHRFLGFVAAMWTSHGRLENRLLAAPRTQIIPERSRDQTKQSAVERAKRKLPIKVICEKDAAKRADDHRCKIAVSPGGKRQPCQSENREPLEDVKDDAFVLAERTQSRPRSNCGEQRKTTGRGNRRDRSAGSTNAIEKNETAFHRQLYRKERPRTIAVARGARGSGDLESL